ncbi:MAG: ComEC/Rec2 family competence protein [Azospirillaceae bacterium]|nr:ComEC/Rec2 family competence protein [Azospirillaceae bacterium]
MDADPDQDDETGADGPHVAAACRSVAAGARRLGRLVLAQFLADRHRWVLWIPVGIGLGVGGYFGLDDEPPRALGATILAIAVVAAARFRHRPVAFLLTMPVLWVALGFAAAQLREDTVAAPVLATSLNEASVAGRVAETETTLSGARVTLDQLTIGGLAPDQTPARVSIRLRPGLPAPPPGAVIAMTAMLHPPPPPVMPGAPDPRRRAWFARIGGYGYATRLPVMLEPPPEGGLAPITTILATARGALAARIAAAVPDPAAAGVITALMTGRQVAIPEPVLRDLRNAGLAHIIVIAGLHIGLVAGLVFLTCRSGLALMPWVALRYPIKKWSAVVALAAAVGYTVLVGAPVPTLRAVAMTTLALVGVVIDRTTLGMRLIAAAAAAVLLIYPEALSGASFQLSFAAVLALIAGYEAASPRLARWRREVTLATRLVLYFFGIAFSSAIATAATTPFVLFHFQQIAWYGVLANVIAIPITAFWVMPCAIVTLLASPFGLDAAVLSVMARGVGAIIAVAHGVSHLPGATAPLPAMPLRVLVAIALGGLWLTLWTRPWRFAGLAPILIGSLVLFWVPRPAILVSGDGHLIAVRDDTDGLILSNRAADRIVGRMWRQRDGWSDAADIPVWPRQGSTKDELLRCDATGCLYRLEGITIALIRHPSALTEDCRNADVVITDLAIADCPAPLLLDRPAIERAQGIALFLHQGQVRLETVASDGPGRPWTQAGTRSGGRPSASITEPEAPRAAADAATEPTPLSQ